MNSLNSILIEGKVTEDPVCIADYGTDNLTDKMGCEFVIEVKKYHKIDNEYQKEVSFFTVQAWSRLAEVCGAYLKRGRGVRIVGRLKQYRWTEGNNKFKSRFVIIADKIECKSKLRSIT